MEKFSIRIFHLDLLSSQKKKSEIKVKIEKKKPVYMLTRNTILETNQTTENACKISNNGS